MKLKQKDFKRLNFLSLVQSPWLIFTFVAILASIFRLTNLQLIEFKGDEGLNLFLATRPLFGHAFPPASLTSSVGILNFPLLNYFLFPIVLISYYPPFVSGCIALLNILAIGVFFLTISKYFGKLTAFITSCFLAFSPWAIIYSRKIWAQDFLIPLVVGLLLCFFKIYIDKKKIYWLIFGIISLFLMQIHQTSGILPVLLFLVLLTKTKPNLKLLALGVLIGFLPTIPYLWYEISSSCPDCSALLMLHGRLQDYHPDIFMRIFQIVTTGYFHTILGNTDNLLFTTLFPLIGKISKIGYLIYLLLPVSAIIFWIKNKEYRSFLIMTALILVIFFMLKVQPEMHYVIILMPFLFLFLGFFISFLIVRKNLTLKLLGISLFVLFLTLYISFDYSFFSLLSTKKGFGGDYGGTFFVAQQTAQRELQTYKNSKDYNEMLLAFYVPLSSIQGDTPVGQILYPLKDLQNNFSKIDSELKVNPIDPRHYNEAVAYYTYPQNENLQNIFYLKKMSKDYSSYGKLYSISLGDFMSKNHKHFYSNGYVWFDFPEHWDLKEDNDTISVSDENVSFTISNSTEIAELDENMIWDKIQKNVAKQ
ncbi:MAG TPA: glycosyltransferase family 39 protein, partial [Patescibacteria group bacterium]